MRTCKVTLRRVRETTGCRGKVMSIMCVCVCSLSYPAYKAHVPYYIATLAFLPPPYFSTLS
jgi:hypothetical protein